MTKKRARALLAMVCILLAAFLFFRFWFMERLVASRLAELAITDSIQATEAVRVAHNIRVLSIAPLIGEAIGRTASEESVSSLFD